MAMRTRMVICQLKLRERRRHRRGRGRHRHMDRRRDNRLQVPKGKARLKGRKDCWQGRGQRWMLVVRGDRWQRFSGVISNVIIPYPCHCQHSLSDDIETKHARLCYRCHITIFLPPFFLMSSSLAWLSMQLPFLFPNIPVTRLSCIIAVLGAKLIEELGVTRRSLCALYNDYTAVIIP